jgi:selenide,water dikinase
MTSLLRHRLVLVGGGHAHVQVLRRLAMRPLASAHVTLVVDDPIAVYSGMVPGFVAGQ